MWPQKRSLLIVITISVVLILVSLATLYTVAYASLHTRGVSITSVAHTPTTLPTVAATLTNTATPTKVPATNTPEPTATNVPPPPPQALPFATGVRVSGRQFVDASGRVIRLIGVNESHLEYFCTADHMGVADFQAMRSWGFDTVRFTLSSEYWNHCDGYQATVKTVVANAESVGMYVILVLQWNAPFNTPYDLTHGGAQYPMPDNAQDVTFWQQVATTYRGDNRVLFDLMGEPHDISWSTWLDGGPVTVSTPQYPISGTYQAIGMLQLSQMIRAIGTNVIILSGNEYGYDLSGVLKGYHVTLPNIVYGTHPFDWSGKQLPEWNYNFGSVSEYYPVIVTEFGGYDCTTRYSSQVIAYANEYNLSWLAWNWGVGICTEPNILATWAGAPTSPYGIYIKDQALAIYRP